MYRTVTHTWIEPTDQRRPRGKIVKESFTTSFDDDTLSRKTTEYFGGREPVGEDFRPPQSSLTFNDENIRNIAALVFKGMQGEQAWKSSQLEKHDIKAWTKKIMEKKHPGKKFSEEAFEKGWLKLDVTRDGKINYEDIRVIVEKKVKKENLYVKK